MEPEAIPNSDGAVLQSHATEEGADVQPAIGSTRPPKPRKVMPSRSVAWKHFIKMKNTDGELIGKCFFCAKEVPAHPRRNGTSGLRSHLVTCKQKPHKSESCQTELTGLVGNEPGFAASLTTWAFDQETSKVSLANMIIEDELPFRFVEGKGFRKFMRVVQPRFKVPSRQTISRVCFTRYVDEKLRMKQLLVSNCQRVSITTDTWTSIQRINYMVVTTHFIDNDWKLHKNIINFCPIASHKGDVIGKVLEKCLSDWGLMSKVFTITVDNAKSNDKAVNWIRRKMTVLGASVLGGEFLHVRCIAHIINLVVTDGLKNDIKSIFRIREAVRYVRQSPYRLLMFTACVEKEHIECKAGLCLDVCTRWNSTYLMLESACNYEKAFEAYADLDPFFKIELESKGLKKTGKNSLVVEEVEHDSLEDENVGNEFIKENFGGLPMEDDWNCARRLASCLRFFYDLTKFVSGSHYVTANAFFDEITNVATLLKEWKDGSDYELSILAESMKQKLDKYWGDVTKYNSLFYISSILDPRNKYMYVQFCLNDLHGTEIGGRMGKKVREEIGKLYHCYFEMYKPNKEVDTTEGDNLRERKSSNVKAAQLMDARKNRFKKFKSDCGAAAEGGSELDLYLQEPALTDDSEFVLLDWWKKHSPRFPILSKMARDILAVPVSTVASECAFSTGGRVLDSFRSSLTPRVVQALICTQDWIRTSKEPIIVEENINDLDKLDSELAKLVLEPAISEM